MLNIVIHNTVKTSPPRIAAVAMRRAGLLFDAGWAAGAVEFMIGNPRGNHPDCRRRAGKGSSRSPQRPQAAGLFPVRGLRYHCIYATIWFRSKT
jgi:hypothetical protein